MKRDPMTWEQVGIEVDRSKRGQQVAFCPKCSKFRKKSRVRCLSVNVDEGEWFCHHCGASGSLNVGWFDDPDFSRNLAPAQPREYKKAYPLPETPPPASPGETPSSPDEEAWDRYVDYCGSRGISEVTMRRNRLTVVRHYMVDADEGDGAELWSLAFPYFDGETHVNTKYRTGAIRDMKPENGKLFQMVGGAERVLYGLNDIGHHSYAFIVEGEFDKLAMEEAGFPMTVSVPNGAPGVNAKNYDSQFNFMDTVPDRFPGIKTWYLCGDADAAGRKLNAELARRLGPERCKHVDWSLASTNEVPIKDANDALRVWGKDQFKERVKAITSDWPVDGLKTVKDFSFKLLDRWHNGPTPALSTGWATLDSVYKVLPGTLTIVTAVPNIGKALALDTPIPTPTGWSTQGNLRIGDEVYDEDGNVCHVTGVSEVWSDRPCYRVTFSDGTSIVADERHEWLTRSESARLSGNRRAKRGPLKPRGIGQSEKWTFPSVVETGEIAKSLTVRGRCNHAIIPASPINGIPDELPVHPYVLGVWLGDGHTDEGRITTADQEVVDAISLAGYSVVKQSGDYLYGVKGLKQRLRNIGVLGDKHIPTSYLRGTEDVRRGVLAGLIDSDGHVQETGSVEITLAHQRLSNDAAELSRSLGFVTTVTEDVAKLNGRIIGPRYRVRFCPQRIHCRIPRKRERILNRDHRKNVIRIVGCERVESVPVRCIQVDSASHLYLAGESMIPTHNSTFLNALMMNLMMQHDIRFAVCSPEWRPTDDMIQAMIKLLVGKPFDKWHPNRVTLEELRYAESWLHERVMFTYPEVPTMPSILQVADVAVQRIGARAVIIDPFSELETSKHRPHGTSQTEWIGQIVRDYSHWLSVRDMVGFLVVHPTKIELDENGEFPVLNFYDISGSAKFADMSDFILSLWRSNFDDTGEMEVHVKKARYRYAAKRNGVASLWFDPLTERFADNVDMIGGTGTVDIWNTGNTGKVAD